MINGEGGQRIEQWNCILNQIDEDNWDEETRVCFLSVCPV